MTLKPSLYGKNPGMPAIKRFIMPSFEGNIPKFFIYQALYNFMLFLPVWVIFLQQKHGLSLTQVTLIDSAFWLTMVFTEVPTGAVADTMGRKYSQFIGMLLATGSLLFFALAPNYPLLILANSLWAFAITFISGADLALFYDTLQELGRTSEYPKYRGWISAVRMTATAISGLLGGFVGSRNLEATFLITALLMVLATLFLIWLKEPPLGQDTDLGMKFNYRQALKLTFETIRQRIELRYALLYSSLLYLMPAAIRVTFIQPYVLAIGLPIASLGVIALVFRIFQVGGSTYAGKISQRLGEWKLLLFFPIPIFIGLLAIGGIESWVGIALFASSGFFSAAATPTIENVINRQTPSPIRATILSVDSLIFRLLSAMLSPCIGLVADSLGLAAALTWMALINGVLIIGLMLYWGRLRNRTGSVLTGSME
jgi:MFS family permease